MNNKMDENAQEPAIQIRLYRVMYLHENEEQVTELLLQVEKHNRNEIKKMISMKENIKFKDIKKEKRY
jgi:hypothetical protein